MSDQPNFERQAQTVLWAQWVFVCTFAWSLGILIGVAFDIPFASQPHIAILGGLLALGQWLILRHFFGGMGWLVLPWIVATALGAVIGQTLGDIFTEMIGPAFLEAQVNPALAVVVGSFLGMLFGFSIGAAQFLVLTIGRMPNAVIWVLVNVVGWGIGLSVSAMFVLPLWLSMLVSVITASVVTGLGVGYFTTFRSFGLDE
jgi:hypothetical protein